MFQFLSYVQYFIRGQRTYVTLFNFGFKRFFRIFLLADVKCHYYELGVQGIYTILILDIHVMINIINN